MPGKRESAERRLAKIVDEVGIEKATTMLTLLIEIKRQELKRTAERMTEKPVLPLLAAASEAQK
jgi:hypothetical protein